MGLVAELHLRPRSDGVRERENGEKKRVMRERRVVREGL
jgi:hypothetical protein